ncbi:hypothetical protein [uncultured Methanobrevibacter sp.]|uniref:hypothetical protein n=1 Tax=uncultured Methanobrevibacter sp. TaxID=253161 RepID=UPI0025CEE2F6|nr:hypothetical protein [uncultured Methanobrevibacter sp.]
MAYLCVDKNGDEKIFDSCPTRDGFGDEDTFWMIFDYYDTPDYGINLPKGSIQRLIGRELTWKDEPVNI